MRHYGVFAVALFALALSCKQKPNADSTGGGGGGGRKGRGGGGGGAGDRVEYAVEVTSIVFEKADLVIEAPGTIEAFERVQVTARVAGVVGKVAFAEGQEVKLNAPLIAIDPERYQLAVNRARATYNKAEASLAEAKSGLERREKASAQNPGLIPEEELDTYRTRVRTAQAESASQHEALKTAELNLRDAYVRAPLAGVIQTRTVETGQYVNPGAILATLLRADPLLLRFPVTSLEATRVKPAMSTEFTLRDSKQTFQAKITLVAAAADAKSRLVQVTAEVDATSNRHFLRPGIYVDVKMSTGNTREAPIVPRAAIRPSERGFLAYVVKDGIAQERELELGMNTSDGRVEVRKGLAAGDQLVVRGGEPLAQGSRVRVVDPKATPRAANSAESDGSSAQPGGSGAPPAHSAERRRKREGNPP